MIVETMLVEPMELEMLLDKWDWEQEWEVALT
jgi:hypothetical protein